MAPMSTSAVEAAARHGINVQDLAIDALHQSSAEVSELYRVIREAKQHLEHGRPVHALKALNSALEA
jgi:hypothetical protein